MNLTQAQILGVKTGDQLLYESAGILGDSISYFTDSPYTHTGTIVVIGGFVFVLEAVADVAGGVRLISLWDSIAGRKVVLLKLKRGLLLEDLLYEDLKKITSRQYDKETLLKHAQVKLGKFGKLLQKIFPSLAIKEKLNEHICSGLSGHIYEKYHILENVNTSSFTPADYIRNPLLRGMFHEKIYKLGE